MGLARFTLSEIGSANYHSYRVSPSKSLMPAGVAISLFGRSCLTASPSLIDTPTRLIISCRTSNAPTEIEYLPSISDIKRPRRRRMKRRAHRLSSTSSLDTIYLNNFPIIF